MRKNADNTALMSLTSCSQVFILEIKKKLLWKFVYSSFSHSDVTSEHLLPYPTGVACQVATVMVGSS
jgi:hypothetical protein